MQPRLGRESDPGHTQEEEKNPTHTCKSYQEPVSISCQPLQANAHHHLQREKQTNKQTKLEEKKNVSEVTKITRQKAQ